MPMWLKQTVKSADEAAAKLHVTASAVHQQSVRRLQLSYPESQGQRQAASATSGIAYACALYPSFFIKPVQYFVHSLLMACADV